MPRFFFDFAGHGFGGMDEHGEELHSPDAAKDAALEFAAELAAEHFRPQGRGSFEVRVRDEAGRRLCKVTATFHVEVDARD
jgi:hypothetical protein